MTIVTHGDEATLEQIVKQLNKLPDVIKVQDFHEGEYVDANWCWSRWRWTPRRVPRSCKSPTFPRQIVDVQRRLVIEITGAKARWRNSSA